MPGKRLKDPSLTRTTFIEAHSNGGELLTDWDGLVWARPIPIELVGNAWWQGSYDGSTWSNTIQDDHTYARVSTDGGITWLVFKMSDCDGSGSDTHPPVTIGNPDGGLVISGDDTQILTLNSVTTTNPGVIEPDEYIKILNLKYDYLANIGGGYEVYKDYTNVDDVRTHNLRTLVAGLNTTISYVGDTIVISSNTSSTTGQANTGHNDGTLGYGVYDRMNGDILEFRHIATTGDIIDITLDDVNNNILLEIVEANIDHDVLENFEPDEHVDHSLVSILTEEGITGGGDITATRTLTLAFDELTSTTYDQTDYIAIYDPTSDTHYKLLLSSLPFGEDNLDPVTITAGIGLSGGGLLDQNRTINLSINSLPTVTYNSADYLAIYDVSTSSHAKVTLSSIIGALAVNITAGDGMDFTTITSTGSIDMGTPTTLTKLTTDLASGTSHQHEVDLSTWDLQDLGNVDTPTDQYYIYYDSGTNTFKFDDPAIGASSPANPLYSIQFNENGSFGGSSGLTYYEDFGRLNLTNTGLDTHGINLGVFFNSSSVVLQGTTGTANITGVGGLTKLVTFSTDLETTANNFVTSFAGDYTGVDITVTTDAGVLTFTGADNTPISSAVITNVTGDLSGTTSDSIEQTGAQIYLDSAHALIRKLIFENNVSGADTIELLSNRVFIGTADSTANNFLYIQDPNLSQYSNSIYVDNGFGDNLLKLSNTGELYLPQLQSVTTLNMLYFNSDTGRVTYGAAPGGSGGISTLIADSLSGLMVNGGSSSSASSIELDQNDNKLTSATPVISDYIGFYDVSTGLQSKAQLSSLPGWNLYLGGISQEAIKLGDNLNFVAGSNVSLSYSSTTNSLEIAANVTGISTDINNDWVEFEFGDFTAGTDRLYTLDIDAFVDYTIVSLVLETDTGSLNSVVLKVNGTAVTGINGVASGAYSSYNEYLATALNTVTIGDRVDMNIGTSYSGSPTFIRGKMKIVRT